MVLDKYLQLAQKAQKDINDVLNEAMAGITEIDSKHGNALEIIFRHGSIDYLATVYFEYAPDSEENVGELLIKKTVDDGTPIPKYFLASLRKKSGKNAKMLRKCQPLVNDKVLNILHGQTFIVDMIILEHNSNSSYLKKFI